MTNNITRPVRVEVDLVNIEFNIKEIKKIISPATFLTAVVKANAYGHGVIPVSKAVIKAGADRLAVALPEEGLELREAGFTLAIHILGEVLAEQVPILIDYDLIPTISKIETVHLLNKLAKKKDIVKKVHIKIDTGMGRIGVLFKDALDFILEVNTFSNIKIEGLVTHFAKADEKDEVYTLNQWEEFNNVLKDLEKEGLKIPIKHVANSATIIEYPEMELDMVRPGIMIYGLRPSEEMGEVINLKPALSWKAHIVYLKELAKGRGVSYGATFVTSRKTKIATIPLGYADGYSRLLSNKGVVLINGKKAPIIGRICMDQFMVDVTDIPESNIGDEVVLIGKQGNEEITVNKLADLMGTINYEVVCRISERIPRVYPKNLLN